MRVLIISLLIAGLSALLTIAAPTDPTTVSTPHGPRPAETVHFVPEGGEVRIVGDQIHLIDADGSVLHVAQNERQRVRATPIGSATETDGSAYAYWYNTGASPINRFSTSWVVPPAPAEYVGQTIYLFSAIEPASGDAILQPVLQYGPSAAGGGAYWSVASWWLTGSQAYYSPLVRVSVGQVLTGVITLTNSSGGTYSYTSAFSGLSGASIATGYTEVLVWPTVALEIYDVSNSAGSTTFYDIDITTTAGVPSVTWTAVSDPSDGILVTIDAQGATNAKTTFTY